ncbi:MAG TPA: PrsW family glutamic-type intramembrane protease [Candidatus Paceibacterota bacterium]|nr:PrsW family glutamic-type intramembrane protease [Candidatus Paceibacterota bacterium]
MPTAEIAIYAFLGGVLPALVWLYFLLKEDSRCPEPRPLIILALMTGMLAVPLVLPLEHMARAFLPSLFPGISLFDRFALDPTFQLPIVLAWAVIEETVKYALAALFILWRQQVDEPVDLVIYMLSVALGFAALENTLFLIVPLTEGDIVGSLLSNNLRFIGATLLHVIASSAIGFSLAFAFRKPLIVRAAAASAGLVLAIALHAIFNFLIIKETASHTLLAFFLVWSGIVVFFALFELLRYARYKRLPKNTC